MQPHSQGSTTMGAGSLLRQTNFILSLLLIFALVLLACETEAHSLLPPMRPTGRAPITGNEIYLENKLQGTREWWHPQGPKLPAVEGFATKFSYFPEEAVRFKITTVNPNMSAIKLKVYRLGYYGGDGARLIGEIASQVVVQPACNFELATRMTHCSNWNITATWIVPEDATTGVYVALPLGTTDEGGEEKGGVELEYVGSYIPLVVMQPKKTRRSAILFKTADATYTVYNQYGGWNLYRGNGSFTFASRASKASYDRPYANRLAAPKGAFINFIFGAEYPMIYWLEKNGYSVSYVGCAAFERMYSTEDNILNADHYSVLLSVGHDEYWTQAIKSAHYHARENGINLAFFSGNEAYWRVVWNDTIVSTSTDAAATTTTSSLVKFTEDPQRIIVCAKESIDNISPIITAVKRSVSDKSNNNSNSSSSISINNSYKSRSIGRLRDNDGWTGTFVDPRHRAPDPENTLTGQLFLVNGFRADAMDVLRGDAMLRFWRDTDVRIAARNVVLTGAEPRGRNKSFSVAVTSKDNNSSNLNSKKQLAANTIKIKEHSASPTPLGRKRAANLQPHAQPTYGALEIVHTTPKGVIGYEIDVAVNDCYSPPGLFKLSHTHLPITNQLAENYGASYKGSGTVTHSLTMYRHFPRWMRDDIYLGKGLNYFGSHSDQDNDTGDYERVNEKEISASSSLKGHTDTSRTIKSNGHIDESSYTNTLAATDDYNYDDDYDNKIKRIFPFFPRDIRIQCRTEIARVQTCSTATTADVPEKICATKSDQNNPVIRLALCLCRSGKFVSSPLRKEVSWKWSIAGAGGDIDVTSSAGRNVSKADNDVKHAKKKHAEDRETRQRPHDQQRQQQRQQQQTKKKYINNGALGTSLVFGAGTVQWSWALSSFHDGPYMPPDPALQQATINLLADMGAYPNWGVVTAVTSSHPKDKKKNNKNKKPKKATTRRDNEEAVTTTAVMEIPVTEDESNAWWRWSHTNNLTNSVSDAEFSSRYRNPSISATSSSATDTSSFTTSTSTISLAATKKKMLTWPDTKKADLPPENRHSFRLPSSLITWPTLPPLAMRLLAQHSAIVGGRRSKRSSVSIAGANTTTPAATVSVVSGSASLAVCGSRGKDQSVRRQGLKNQALDFLPINLKRGLLIKGTAVADMGDYMTPVFEKDGTLIDAAASADGNNLYDSQHQEGKGKVSAVHVSVTAGKSWHAAVGREHWHFHHKFSTNNLLPSSSITSSTNSTNNSTAAVNMPPSWHGTYHCSGAASRSAIRDGIPIASSVESSSVGVSDLEASVPGYLWNRFRDELMDLNILYDEYKDYSTLKIDSSSGIISQQQAGNKRVHVSAQQTSAAAAAASSATRTSNNTSSGADVYHRMLMIVISTSVDDSGWMEPTLLDSAETEMLLMCAVLERVSQLGLWPKPVANSFNMSAPGIQDLSESIKRSSRNNSSSSSSSKGGKPRNSSAIGSGSNPDDDDDDNNHDLSCERQLFHLDLNNVRLVNVELQRFK